jgi:hypothetical protein
MAVVQETDPHVAALERVYGRMAAEKQPAPGLDLLLCEVADGVVPFSKQSHLIMVVNELCALRNALQDARAENRRVLDCVQELRRDLAAATQPVALESRIRSLEERISAALDAPINPVTEITTFIRDKDGRVTGSEHRQVVTGMR